ncbi:MAG: RNA-directed DNA polymerase [Candidatus Gracilibacteria bacterium]|nr:RNA-directed DNA polymerase [Candidatus Gracilibacteria bacterium]
MIEFGEFKKYFNNNFWKRFHQKVVFFPILLSSEKEEIIETLYNDLLNKKYYPSIPRAYIFENKGKGVTRKVPVFEIKDYCLYYYCVKRLEKKIAYNRVDNTFGGWSLGGVFRKSEDEEMKFRTETHNSFEDELANYHGVSLAEYSFNPTAWSKAYGDFSSKLYASTQEASYKYAVELDISNFYDCIRLDLLEIWIREVASKDNAEDISVLFHFLNYWNRESNKYDKQTVGVPQDAFADCSRILANFYLQRHDQYTYELCEINQCRYLRYADDQFIFGESKEKLEYLIYLISVNLSKFGLNLNQKKVKYWEIDELTEHRSFKLFDLAKDKEDRKNKENVEKFLDSYFYIRDSGLEDSLKKRGISLLRKALLCDLSIVSLDRRIKTLGYALEEDFLRKAEKNYLKRIYENLDTDEKKQEFINQLKTLANEAFYNSIHFRIKSFFEDLKIDTKEIDERIDFLNNREPKYESGVEFI